MSAGPWATRNHDPITIPPLPPLLLHGGGGRLLSSGTRPPPPAQVRLGQGATIALPSVREAGTAREAWQELGLEEMSECDEGPMSVWDVDSGGSDSHNTGTETEEAVMSGDSDSDSDYAMLELPLKRHCANRDPRGGQS